MTSSPTALDLPMVTPLPEATQKYFDICQDKLGMVPNVLQAYAFDIDKLNAFTTLYNDVMLADSGLSKLEREMIAVVVSSINKCFYCLTAHGAAVRALSGDPILGEQLVMNYRTADLDARQKAIAQWMRSIDPIPSVLKLMLGLLRDSAAPHSVAAKDGMYQQNLPQGRNVSLIRIGVPDRAGWVPEVSANRLLISVRIMRIEDGHRTQSMKADVDFLISNCG